MYALSIYNSLCSQRLGSNSYKAKIALYTEIYSSANLEELKDW